MRLFVLLLYHYFPIFIQVHGVEHAILHGPDNINGIAVAIPYLANVIQVITIKVFETVYHLL